MEKQSLFLLSIVAMSGHAASTFFVVERCSRFVTKEQLDQSGCYCKDPVETRSVIVPSQFICQSVRWSFKDLTKQTPFLIFVEEITVQRQSIPFLIFVEAVGSYSTEPIKRSCNIENGDPL